MPYEFPDNSLEIQARLSDFGVTSDHLRLTGAFIVAYGLFETGLERALWALTETNVSGTRPFTETITAKQQFSMLGAGTSKLNQKCNEVLKVASHAAEDLNEYRNSLVHGHLISFGAGAAPSFLRNPAWQDEKRSSTLVTRTSSSRFRISCSSPHGRSQCSCDTSRRRLLTPMLGEPSRHSKTTFAARKAMRMKRVTCGRS
jgi:hypothetical protein